MARTTEKTQAPSTHSCLSTLTMNWLDPNPEKMTPLSILSLWAGARVNVSEGLEEEAVHAQIELTGASWGSQVISQVGRMHKPSPLSPTSLSGV